MATRSQRRGKAKARRNELEVAVKVAFMEENARIAAKQAREIALIEVNKWHRKGTRAICHPGLDKVC
jgi:hypothetical protein